MTDQEIKSFPAHAVGTMATGVCLGDFGEATAVAEWVMGYPIWTHEYPSLGNAIRDAIIAQYPDMPTRIEAKQGWEATRDSIVAKYGAEIALKRGTGERSRHPIETAAAAISGKNAAP